MTGVTRLALLSLALALLTHHAPAQGVQTALKTLIETQWKDQTNV